MKVKNLMGALALSSLCATANAGLMGVKYIEIQNGLTPFSSLQVAEVVATNKAGQDAALTGSAVASSNGYYNDNTKPENAIDGGTRGYFGLGDIYHGPKNPIQPLGYPLRITFNDIQELMSVQIFGRQDSHCQTPSGQAEHCGARDLYKVSFFSADDQLLSSAMVDSRNGVAGSVSVSEPGTLALLGLGLVGLGAARRQQKS